MNRTDWLRRVATGTGLVFLLVVTIAEPTQARRADSANADARIRELEAKIQDLQDSLAGANAIVGTQAASINSLVARLFGSRADANVAAAARDEARARLAQAVALVGAGNRDLVRARGAFSDGQAALAAGDHARALREFRRAYDIACRRPPRERK